MWGDKIEIRKCNLKLFDVRNGLIDEAMNYLSAIIYRLNKDKNETIKNMVLLGA